MINTNLNSKIINSDDITLIQLLSLTMIFILITSKLCMNLLELIFKQSEFNFNRNGRIILNELKNLIPCSIISTVIGTIVITPYIQQYLIDNIELNDGILKNKNSNLNSADKSDIDDIESNDSNNNQYNQNSEFNLIDYDYSSSSSSSISSSSNDKIDSESAQINSFDIRQLSDLVTADKNKFSSVQSSINTDNNKIQSIPTSTSTLTSPLLPQSLSLYYDMLKEYNIKIEELSYSIENMSSKIAETASKQADLINSKIELINSNSNSNRNSNSKDNNHINAIDILEQSKKMIISNQHNSVNKLENQLFRLNSNIGNSLSLKSLYNIQIQCSIIMSIF